jgi:Got1/Sft2-like family
MFDATRRETSIIYLSCLGLTLLTIFLPMPGPLKLFLLLSFTITQFCASVWYSLSYIPYGRRTAMRFIRNTLGLDDGSSATAAGYSGLGFSLPSLGVGGGGSNV